MAETRARGGQRVKLYVLNADGKWDDRGTGHALCKAGAAGNSSLQIHFRREGAPADAVSKVIAVQTDVAYHLQGRTIISWAERAIPPLSAVEMALSFAEPAGCSEVWNRICAATRAGERRLAQEQAAAAQEAERVGSPGAGPSSRPVVTGGGEEKGENAEQGWGAAEDGEESFQSAIMMLANSAHPLAALTASSAVDLPPVNLVIPPPDRASLGSLLQTLTDHFSMQKALRDRLCSELIAGRYVERLCELFQVCEGDGDTIALAQLYFIFRSMCLGGNHPLAKVLVERAHVMDVIGCLEYDSESLSIAGLSVRSIVEEKEKPRDGNISSSAEESGPQSKRISSKIEEKIGETNSSLNSNGPSAPLPSKNASSQPSSSNVIDLPRSRLAPIPISSQPSPLPSSESKGVPNLSKTPKPEESDDISRCNTDSTPISETTSGGESSAGNPRTPGPDVDAPSASCNPKSLSPCPVRQPGSGSPRPEGTQMKVSVSGNEVPSTTNSLSFMDSNSASEHSPTVDAERVDDSMSPDHGGTKSTAAMTKTPPSSGLKQCSGDEHDDKNSCLKYSKPFSPLRKHRDFLENRSTFKAVLKLTNHKILTKIHTNFVVEYIRNFVLGRVIEDNYSSSFGMVVNCNNGDILRHILRNFQLIRDLFEKIIDLFQRRSKKRSAVDSSGIPKSPKRHRGELSTSSGESARSIQQVRTDSNVVSMETESLSPEDNRSSGENELNTSAPAWMIQEISDALRFCIQLCEISKNQGALRTQLFCMLRSYGILDICVISLKDKLEEIRQLGSNLLNSIATQDAIELKKYMLNTVEDEGKNVSQKQNFVSNTVRMCLRSARSPLAEALLSNPSDKNSAVSVVSKEDTVSLKNVDSESKDVNSGPKDNDTLNTASDDAKDSQKALKDEDTEPKPEIKALTCNTAPSKADDAPSKSSKEGLAVFVAPSPLAEKDDVAMKEMNAQSESEPEDVKVPIPKENGSLLEASSCGRTEKTLSPSEANLSFPLMATMVNVACGDENIGVVLQAIDLLRGLMDMTPMRVEVSKDTFTEKFYAHFASRLINPIVEAGLGKEDGGKDSTTRKRSVDDKIPYLCDFMSFCIARHSYISKYFVISHDVGGKVAKLLQHKNKCIRLSALRFLRTCVGAQEKVLDDYILRKELLKPVMEMYRENKHCDNLTSSAVLDVVDFVSKKGRRALLQVIVEQFSDILEPSSGLCSTFESAKTTLHNLQNPRAEANGSVSIGSDMSLINGLSLAPEGRLESRAGVGGSDQSGVNAMMSLLSQPSDSPGIFAGGRHNMSLFFGDLRLPAETDESSFSSGDEMYNPFPDLMEEKDNSNSVSLSATDLWFIEDQQQASSTPEKSGGFPDASKQADVEESQAPLNAPMDVLKEVQKEDNEIGSSSTERAATDHLMTEQSDELGSEAVGNSSAKAKAGNGDVPKASQCKEKDDKMLADSALREKESVTPGSPSKRPRSEGPEEESSSKRIRVDDDTVVAKVSDCAPPCAEVSSTSARKDDGEQGDENEGSSEMQPIDNSRDSSNSEQADEKSTSLTEAR